MASLFEKYRPRTLDDVIGQDMAVACLKRLQISGNLGGQAYWISGNSGQGKTTITRIVASLVAGEGITEEIKAANLNRAKFAEIDRKMQSRPLFGGYAWIINEAHTLKRSQVESLLTLLEPEGGLPAYVVFVFTTTRMGQKKMIEDIDDASPLLSRCLPVPFSNQGLARPFAVRCKEIAMAEGLDGKPEKAYLKLAEDCHNNLREMLQRIFAGEMLSD